MNDYVADTHTLLWYLAVPRLLGTNASAAFDEADSGNAFIHIPSIVWAELYFLNKKQGNIFDFPAVFQTIEKSGQFILTPFDAEDVLEFDRDAAVREMHDRIIVGVSRRLNAPLLTKDENIVKSGLVRIIW